VTGQSGHTILITTSSFGAGNNDLLIRLREAGQNVILNPHKRKLTEAEVSELVRVHRPVGMIAGVEPLTKQVLADAKGLKVISRCGGGTDSVDLAAARRLGITVTATPDAVTIPVAELTLGLILGVLRHIHTADASVRRGGWERPMGRLLFEKTVGIIGLGRIGSYLSRLLSPFGCRLVGFDPAIASHEICRLTDLDELLGLADIITLHIPFSEETRRIINGKRISMMKEGAVLVNAARGGLVDEQALEDALKSGHLSGAALDCFEQEPYLGKLKEFPQVLLTSHIGGYAVEARAMMEKQAVDNLLFELGRQGVIP
jgi:D-3-phosphoglycerate dehydrogenase / 2-oxoglutarate reductase